MPGHCTRARFGDRLALGQEGCKPHRLHGVSALNYAIGLRTLALNDGVLQVLTSAPYRRARGQARLQVVLEAHRELYGTWYRGQVAAQDALLHHIAWQLLAGCAQVEVHSSSPQ
ncbi:hypothetical protein D3C85_1512180 [compost metagenome]